MEKNLSSILLGVLLIGVLFGFGVSYLFYGPEIASINTQINELENQIDTSIPTIESELEDLGIEIDQVQGDVEEEKAAMGGISTSVEETQNRIGSIEKEQEEFSSTVQSSINNLREDLTQVETELQNENTIIRVYSNVSTAVVFVTSKLLLFNPRSQRNELVEDAVGSGVVVSPEGYILTNNHVVEGADAVTISFEIGEEIEAEVIGTDPPTDLAVLKIDPLPNLPVATIGDSDQVAPGMTAIAIGNPFSLERTVTVGVVSSVNRTIDADTGDIIFGIIQTDAAINPGNSGGPLLNSKGEVIGITSAIISPVRGSVGIGFAIPINTGQKVMTQLIETGKVSRSFLGITGASVFELPPELNMPTKGVLIVDVIIDSPAENAGIIGSGTVVQIEGIEYPTGGDVITSIDGTDVDTIEDLLESLSRKDPGDSIQIGYIRDSNFESMEVILGERRD